MSPAGELAGLDAQRRGWVEDAWRHVTGDRLRELITGLVDIPSPTGDEGPLAEHIADTLTAAGCRARSSPWTTGRPTPGPGSPATAPAPTSCSTRPSTL
jgi:hypothetical protein